MNLKFTDEELIGYYLQGLSDNVIAEKLEVHQSAVTPRRWKLGLPAHFLGFMGTNLNREEMAQRTEERLKAVTKFREKMLEDPNYEQERYMRRVENMGSDLINSSNREQYYRWKSESNKKCGECGELLNPRNRSGFCRSHRRVRGAHAG